MVLSHRQSSLDELVAPPTNANARKQSSDTDSHREAHYAVLNWLQHFNQKCISCRRCPLQSTSMQSTLSQSILAWDWATILCSLTTCLFHI